jgi:hypothetical protein
MASATEYAKWITANANKRGTPEFETVAKAYRAARQQEAGAQPANPGGENPLKDFANDIVGGVQGVGKAWKDYAASEPLRQPQRAPAHNPLEFARNFVTDQVDQAKSNLNLFKAVGSTAMLPTLPVSAAWDSIVAAPLARGMTAITGAQGPQRDKMLADSRGGFNTALMGLMPGKGPGVNVGLAIERGGPPVPKIQADIARKYIAPRIKDPVALAQADPALTAAEAIGQRGKAALGALARSTGATGDDLSGLVSSRQMARPQVIQQEFADAVGITPEAAAGDIGALVDAGRKTAAPLYEQAYAKPVEPTPRLAGLMERPEVSRALKNAQKLIANDPEIPPELGQQLAAEGPNSAQVWDYAKRALDSRIAKVTDQVTGKFTDPATGTTLTKLSKELRSAIAEAHPELGDAWAAAGDYLSTNAAFRNGGKATFNPTITEQEFAKQLAGMTTSERQAFNGGIANHIFDLAQNGRLNPNVFKTPRIRAKMIQALGEEPAFQLFKTAEREAEMAAFEGRYQPTGNAVTSEMGAEMADQAATFDQGQNVARFAQDYKKGIGNLIGRGVQKGLDFALQPKSTAMRNEAGRQLMMSPQELDALLKQVKASKTKVGLKLTKTSDIGKMTSAQAALLAQQAALMQGGRLPAREPKQ